MIKRPRIPTLTGNKAVENMPVRLSGKLPGARPNPAEADALSSQERIRNLQRRSQRYSKDPVTENLSERLPS